MNCTRLTLRKMLKLLNQIVSSNTRSNERLITYNFNYIIIEPNISLNNRAAKLAVILLISKEGDNSTISHPIILVCAKICLIKKVNSNGFNPQGVGTETPGAKAGSKQSRSMEIYILFLLLLLFLIQVWVIFLRIFCVPYS